jgi:hypothetical protein
MQQFNSSLLWFQITFRQVIHLVLGISPMVFNQPAFTFPFRVGRWYAAIAVIVIFRNSHTRHKIDLLLALVEPIDETVLC